MTQCHVTLILLILVIRICLIYKDGWWHDVVWQTCIERSKRFQNMIHYSLPLICTCCNFTEHTFCCRCQCFKMILLSLFTLTQLTMTAGCTLPSPFLFTVPIHHPNIWFSHHLSFYWQYTLNTVWCRDSCVTLNTTMTFLSIQVRFTIVLKIDISHEKHLN